MLTALACSVAAAWQLRTFASASEPLLPAGLQLLMHGIFLTLQALQSYAIVSVQPPKTNTCPRELAPPGRIIGSSTGCLSILDLQADTMVPCISLLSRVSVLKAAPGAA